MPDLSRAAVTGFSLKNPWIALPAAVLGVTLCLILIWPQRINHDVAMELQCAQLLLDGKVPYVDFVELNPPMIIYVNVIPVVLAKLCHVPAAFMLQILVLALAVWSAWTMRKMLLLAGKGVDEAEIGIFLLFWAGVTVYLTNLKETGQREQLFALSYIPFLFLRWRRWEGDNFGCIRAILMGVLAGVIACFKPHFEVAAFVPELYWVVSKRSIKAMWKPEMIAFVMVGLAYAVHFFFLPDAYRIALFERWIPFISRNYAAYNATLRDLLIRSAVVLTLAIAVLPLLIKPRKSIDSWSLSQPIAMFTLAAVAIFAFQHRGFFYQMQPMMYGSALICGLLIAQFRPLAFRNEEYETVFSARWSSKSVARLIGVGFTLIAVFTIGKVAANGIRYVTEDPLEQAIAERTNAGDPVMVLSTSVYTAYPGLMLLDLKPGSRYLWHFPIAMFHHNDEAVNGQFNYRGFDQVSAEERRYLGEITEDLLRIRPKLVVVDNNDESQACPLGFRISEYLDAVGFMDRVKLAYVLRGEVNGFRIYERLDG